MRAKEEATGERYVKDHHESPTFVDKEKISYHSWDYGITSRGRGAGNNASYKKRVEAGSFVNPYIGNDQK